MGEEMALQRTGKIGRRLTRRIVRVERALVQFAMVPIVIIADRRIAKSVRRTA